MTDISPTHQVLIAETEGGDQPLPKAEGHVLGWQTQLDEAAAYAETAHARVMRVQAENEARMADAHDNAVRADSDVERINGELAVAQDNIDDARAAQSAYDALPQSEKDRLAAEKALAGLRAAAEGAQAALAAAEAEAAPTEG